MQPVIYRVRSFRDGGLALMGSPRSDWLDEELSWLARLDFGLVVSLLETDEAASLALGDEAEACRHAGLDFLQLSIRDRGVPGDVDAFCDLVGHICDRLDAGQGVAVHCRAGIGRAGMTSAAVLIASGKGVDEALSEISAARGVGVPDTDEQVQFLMDNAARIGACQA